MNRTELDALFTALNASLNKGLAKEWKGYEKWSMIVNSKGAAEKYPMTLVLGGMREWIGPRVVNRVDIEKLTVLNRDFEHTEAVNCNDIEDDNVGVYAPLFEAMGVDAANLWGRLATEALVNPGNWADGSAFYGTRSLSKKSSITNKVSGALSVSTYETARANMMGWCAADGSPMGLVPDLLVVGPSNESAAKGILETELTVSGGSTVSNIHYKECELQIDPYLTGAHAGKWFLMCTTRGMKPVAVQKRKVGPLVRYDQEHDVCVKEENECHYAVHYRGNAAGVQPLLVVGGNLS